MVAMCYTKAKRPRRMPTRLVTCGTGKQQTARLIFRLLHKGCAARSRLSNSCERASGSSTNKQSICWRSASHTLERLRTSYAPPGHTGPGWTRAWLSCRLEAQQYMQCTSSREWDSMRAAAARTWLFMMYMARESVLFERALQLWSC
jgi:hypothetical protein